MTKEEKLICDSSDTPLNIIDTGLSNPVYTTLDLSCQNEALSDYDITDAAQCQAYIDLILQKNKANVAYGGYLEQRNLYQRSKYFTNAGEHARNIHLGLDIWVKAGTPVLVPLRGKVHSFADNAGYGNYGPAIILEHKVGKLELYTLYGHLSRASLKNIEEGQQFATGTILAALGNPTENGGYAPHLHFQIILDLQGYRGDYPGVCAREVRKFYQKNCPDPNLLLKI